MDITKIKLEDLHEDPANTRMHNPRNLEEIKRSLLAFGQHQPLVVQKSTMRIIVGNGRFRVMKSLGWEEADCYIIDLTDLRAAALSITDNRTTELSTWDDEELQSALLEVSQSEDVELELTGFTVDELSKLMDTGDDGGGDGGGDGPGKDSTKHPSVSKLRDDQHFLLLAFDNELDWQTAESLLGLGTVSGGFEDKGLGRSGRERILDGEAILRRIGAKEFDENTEA